MSSSDVAVVTGAGSGIGRAVAQRLAAEGHDLVLVGRDEDALQHTAATVDGATVLAGDVRDPVTLRRLRGMGVSVRVLVHGAMPVVPMAGVHRVSADDLDDALAMVSAAALWTGFAALGMKTRRFGRIVFLGSKAAELGGPGQAAYGSAKAALVGLMRSLAVELGPYGITSNLLSLGFVDTPRTARFDEATRARIVAHSALGRAGTPAEVASMVAYLCGPEAGFVTGAVVDVSGGAGLGPFGPGRSS